MNAPFTLTPAELEARSLAVDILHGQTKPYGIGGLYTPREWTNAAHYLLDSDDCSEIVYMMEQEDAAERGVEPMWDIGTGSDVGGWQRVYGGFR